MYAASVRRFRSGDICFTSGRYEFDGYLDGSSEFLPAPEEMEVPLRAGQRFPLIPSQWRACYWAPAGEGVAAVEPAGCALVTGH